MHKDGQSLIPTPNLDQLASQGLKLKNHYVHSSCTPSRASLMTGRYSFNVGLPCAMAPGSVAGLPDDVPTMPQKLRDAGYSAHMLGKWHVGHSQWKQTPVGKGFESHVGSFMWNLESYSKLMWRDVATTLAVDWGRYYENETFEHFADPRHATVALTEEAINLMKDHNKAKPLFLYVSYNAAHTPLQADSEWLQQCQHVPHTWRRHYCGLMVGSDLAVSRLVSAAKGNLGDDTIFVVTSDNGGPTWFGGLNAPLRGTKLTPFEGGVRVPGFVLDFSGNYTWGKGEELKHLVHISDWMPTFLSWAGTSGSYLEKMSLDGIDQSGALKNNVEVRNEIMLELFTEKESHDESYSAAFRRGKYKLIEGHLRDPHWYKEPSRDFLDSSDLRWLNRIIEVGIKMMEAVFGSGPLDMISDIIVNFVVYHHSMINEGFQARFLCILQLKQSNLCTVLGIELRSVLFCKTNCLVLQLLLFDVESDPEERINLAKSHPDIVREMKEEIERAKSRRPPHPKYEHYHNFSHLLL